MKTKKKAFVSWSGGKDSYLSFIKAREAGFEIVRLLNFTGNEGRSMSHGVSDSLLKKQAICLGIPLVSRIVTWESYETGFKEAASRFKSEGITTGIFGDINLQDHRTWVENSCEAVGISPHLPLWMMAEELVVNELIDRRCRLLIVSIDPTVISKEWLGKELDSEFMEVCKKKGISVCGESGEYHTLAVDGPYFNEPLEVKPIGVKEISGKLFLDLSE